jgi:hypothetical protein
MQPVLTEAVSLLAKIKLCWFVATLFYLGSIAVPSVRAFEQYPTQIQATSFLNFATIDFSKVNCLSIDVHKIHLDGKEYSDPDLTKTAADILSLTNVQINADYTTCAWGLVETIVPETIYAVRHGLWPAHYLIAAAICERTANDHLDPDKCLNTNVYVFNRSAKPHELLSIGLIGLTRSTKQDGEFFERTPR